MLKENVSTYGKEADSLWNRKAEADRGGAKSYWQGRKQ